MRFIILLPLLAACQLTVDQFHEDFPPAFCAYAVPCAESAPPGETDTAALSESACEAEFADYVDTLESDEGCTFDPEAGQKCLDAIEAATSCSSAETVRDECENVFTGDSCDLHLSALL